MHNCYFKNFTNNFRRSSANHTASTALPFMSTNPKHLHYKVTEISDL